VTPTQLLLIDLDAELVSAWREAFAAQIDEGVIEVRQGSLLDVLPEVDAVLTAGNSYGQMDGDVDRALAGYFPDVQRSVWAAVADEYHGYQPSGLRAWFPPATRPAVGLSTHRPCACRCRCQAGWTSLCTTLSGPPLWP
jgi:hypothetical protein